MTTIEAPKTTPKEVTTADVLERAADVLGEWGWCQGAYVRGGAYCAEGAILRATLDFGVRENYGLLDQADRAILAETGVRHLPSWNDAEGRTKSEVVSLLRQAAERSRETA